MQREKYKAVFTKLLTIEYLFLVSMTLLRSFNLSIFFHQVFIDCLPSCRQYTGFWDCAGEKHPKSYFREFAFWIFTT